ncbi:MAG: glycerate kinase [Ferruginibacter sp.]
MTTKEKAIQIFKAAVAAVQPDQLLPSHLFIENHTLHILGQRFFVNGLHNIYLLGAGKASAAMAKTVEDILGNLITAGIVVTKYGHALPLQKIVCIEAAHPVPDEQGVAATTKTIQLLQQADENDIIICLISGGASSLWIDIPEGASLADVQETFQLLLKSGATIYEVNTIRKHLSALKGGQLLRWAPRSSWFSFIISDVPGDELSVIASGPTVPDTSTFADVKAILEKYGLTDQLPAAILKHVDDGIKGIINETLKAEDPVFRQAHNKIIGSNTIALEAAAEKAAQLGFHIPFIENSLNGDAATVGRELILQCKKYRGILPACFLLGGETTVRVKGNGKGGRNQHMALSAQLELVAGNVKDIPNEITFLSAGTDGTDGPTDAAGAIADRHTLSRAHEKNLDAGKFLNDNDSYHFFEQTGGLVKTGATQTNVMDLVVVIIE